MVTGVFSFVSLALFAIGSTAIFVPSSYRKPWTDIENNFFGGKKWVVLVAGSDGWNNYRHQVLINIYFYNLWISKNVHSIT